MSNNAQTNRPPTAATEPDDFWMYVGVRAGPRNAVVAYMSKTTETTQHLIANGAAGDAPPQPHRPTTGTDTFKTSSSTPIRTSSPSPATTLRNTN